MHSMNLYHLSAKSLGIPAPPQFHVRIFHHRWHIFLFMEIDWKYNNSEMNWIHHVDVGWDVTRN